MDVQIIPRFALSEMSRCGRTSLVSMAVSPVILRSGCRHAGKFTLLVHLELL